MDQMDQLCIDLFHTFYPENYQERSSTRFFIEDIVAIRVWRHAPACRSFLALTAAPVDVASVTLILSSVVIRLLRIEIVDQEL